MKSATAKHLIVDSEELFLKKKKKIANGKKFEDIAKEYSSCPSGSNGGDLGTFFQGQMVPEFDAVVFNEAINVVHGPVKTDFGFHLLETTSRRD